MIFAAMKRVFIFPVLAICLCIASCGRTDLFEQKESFVQQRWASNNRLQFAYDVTDSTSSYYNIYIIIRHTEKYNYNNIWVNLTFIPPNDSSRSLHLNIPLTDSKGWLGAAMDDVYEQRSLVNKNPIKLSAGTYHLMLQQVMREDPLQHILQAGVRVEKVVQ